MFRLVNYGGKLIKVKLVLFYGIGSLPANVYNMKWMTQSINSFRFSLKNQNVQQHVVYVHGCLLYPDELGLGLRVNIVTGWFPYNKKCRMTIVRRSQDSLQQNNLNGKIVSCDRKNMLKCRTTLVVWIEQIIFLHATLSYDFGIWKQAYYSFKTT